MQLVYVSFLLLHTFEQASKSLFRKWDSKPFPCQLSTCLQFSRSPTLAFSPYAPTSSPESTSSVSKNLCLPWVSRRHPFHPQSPHSPTPAHCRPQSHRLTLGSLSLTIFSHEAPLIADNIARWRMSNDWSLPQSHYDISRGLLQCYRLVHLCHLAASCRFFVTCLGHAICPYASVWLIAPRCPHPPVLAGRPGPSAPSSWESSGILLLRGSLRGIWECLASLGWVSLSGCCGQFPCGNVHSWMRFLGFLPWSCGCLFWWTIANVWYRLPRPCAYRWPLRSRLWASLGLIRL